MHSTPGMLVCTKTWTPLGVIRALSSAAPDKSPCDVWTLSTIAGVTCGIRIIYGPLRYCQTSACLSFSSPTPSVQQFWFSCGTRCYAARMPSAARPAISGDQRRGSVDPRDAAILVPDGKIMADNPACLRRQWTLFLSMPASQQHAQRSLDGNSDATHEREPDLGSANTSVIRQHRGHHHFRQQTAALRPVADHATSAEYRSSAA